jgi:two-component system chemotaxis response regulator CheY
MKRCLIVDDAAVIRKVARHLLERLQYQVTEAQDGQEALDRCREAMPDVVLLDWHLPGMSALDFLSALRASHPLRRPFVIYLTTENDTVDIARALAAGADDYLLKPFTRESLELKFKAIAELN